MKPLISQRQKKDVHPYARYFFTYTMAFLVLSAITFSSFWINDKSMIWKPDGLTQHYNAFVYFANWGRSILKTLVTEHRLSIPMWDFSIGYGSDVLTTLHYYVIGDPFNLLAMITPVRFLEALFNVLILFRVFLTGAAFSCYCFYMKRGKTATLAGALTYTFCGYVVVLAPQHPYFINPLIYLPLLLLGIEKVFQKEKGHLLIAMVALSAISNFYFFYMLVVLVVIYCIIRFCTMKHKNWWKELFSTAGRTLLFSLMGAAIGGVLLLPVALQFLSDSRSDTTLSNPLLYAMDFYAQFPDAFISVEYSSYWTHLGFTAIALLCVFVLFLKRGKYTGLKAGFLVLTLMLILPASGSLMNGFSYAVNRWCFGYSFLVSLILTFVWPELFSLSGREKCWLFVLSLVYIGALVLLPYTGSSNAFFSLALMLLTILLLIEAQKLSSFFAFLHEDVRGKLPKLGVLLLLILGIIGNSVTFYRIKPEDHIARFVDYGEGLTTLQETAAGMMSAFYQNQEEFSRYAHEPMPVRNDTLNHDVHSIDYYWSLSNGAITQYFDELALPIEERAFKYNRLDYRSSLHALAGVEYYVRHDPSDYLPYLYSETNMHEFYGDLYYVSGTEEYLPFGYTYDHFISRETYEALPYIQRQQALLQGAVCERQTTNLTEADLRFEEQSVPSEISHEINIIETEDSYYAAEGGAQLTFTFEGLEGCETYLLIEGLEARSMTDIDFLEHEQLSFLFQEDWDELSTYEKRQKRTEDALDLFNTGASTFSFTCASSILETDFSYYTELTESAFDRSDYLINMGYSDTAQTAITLTLPYAGMYSFENLEVLCLPVETLPRHLDALQESVLEQVTFQTNQVTGTISLEKSKFLCLSVPYSSGWSAYVDGNQMPLYQANTMFMGLELDEGEHTIELRYQTPGLQTGLCISTAGFAAWLLYGLSNHTRIIRKRKRTKA